MMHGDDDLIHQIRLTLKPDLLAEANIKTDILMAFYTLAAERGNDVKAGAAEVVAVILRDNQLGHTYNDIYQCVNQTLVKLESEGLLICVDHDAYTPSERGLELGAGFRIYLDNYSKGNGL